MLLHIDEHSGQPIYRQVIDQIRRQVVAGQLPEGEQLPSVRDLAGQLRVNPMTISKAYSLLQMEGLLERRRGVGLFVPRVEKRRSNRAKANLLEEALTKAVVIGAQLGIPKEKIHRLTERLTSKVQRSRKGKGIGMAERSSQLETAIEFADNPEPRCPCVLLLDTSGSMQGPPIAALNQGLQVFRDDLCKDALASRRVELAVVTFDSEVRVVQDFVTADQFAPPPLTAQGTTAMGGGIHKALDMIHARKGEYKANGVTYYRPWVFMITDGEPQGEPDDLVREAAQRIRDDENRKSVAFFAVGVESANMARLGEIVVRTPVKLQGLNFVEMFVWLSRSTQAVSHSKTDEQTALPPAGWGAV